jgi:Putative phage holin Dp-1
MSNKLYDYLKFLAQIGLPATGTLYVTLAAIWGLPAPQEVAATILAVDTFLGVLLGLQSASYNKGVVQAGNMNVVDLESGGKNFSLELNMEPEELEEKKELRFKVQKKARDRRGRTRKL